MECLAAEAPAAASCLEVQQQKNEKQADHTAGKLQRSSKKQKVAPMPESATDGAEKEPASQRRRGAVQPQTGEDVRMESVDCVYDDDFE